MKTSKYIKKLKLTPRRKVYSLFIGNFRSAFKGRGLDFEDLREYIPGDNIKDIDWNASARSNTIYIRKYIENRELNILFAVDTSSSMTWKLNERIDNKSLIIEFVLLICLAAMRNNDRLECLFFDNKVEVAVPPGKGKDQMLRIVRTLDNGLKENNVFKETDYQKMLQYLLKSVRSRKICFVITDNFDYEDEETNKLLKAVAKKHEVILVSINNFLEFLKDDSIPSNIEDIETGEILRLPSQNKKFRKKMISKLATFKNAMTKELRKAQVDTLSISFKSDLLYEMIYFFKQRALRK
jgi:uncharacterized protein (DUF58 family)